MTTRKSDAETVRPRLAQAAADAERMREIARAFRAGNPANPDCDLLDRAATALAGVHTRLLSLAAGGGSPELDSETGDTEDDSDPSPAPRRGPPVVPANSRIQLPDSHRRAAGESRSSVRGGQAGGHGQLPV